MFKKSADLIHLHDRIGSHSTKPSAKGRVDLRKLDSSDFNSQKSRNERSKMIAALSEEIGCGSELIQRMARLQRNSKDKAKRKTALVAVKALSRHLRAKHRQLQVLLNDEALTE